MVNSMAAAEKVQGKTGVALGENKKVLKEKWDGPCQEDVETVMKEVSLAKSCKI